MPRPARGAPVASGRWPRNVPGTARCKSFYWLALSEPITERRRGGLGCPRLPGAPGRLIDWMPERLRGAAPGAREAGVSRTPHGLV